MKRSLLIQPRCAVTDNHRRTRDSCEVKWLPLNALGLAPVCFLLLISHEA
jgi:hypothetical protein